MVEFFIIIVIIGICYLIFGKADSKNDVLNTVGLSLNQQTYENKKYSEYSKYCILAMKKAVDLDEYKARNENEFLDSLNDSLNAAVYGRTISYGFDDERTQYIYLGVKKHYAKHAATVVYRRKQDIKKGNTTLLYPRCNFSDKRAAKKYCELLWEKYQYPWPDNWLQKDSQL